MPSPVRTKGQTTPDCNRQKWPGDDVSHHENVKLLEVERLEQGITLGNSVMGFGVGCRRQ